MLNKVILIGALFKDVELKMAGSTPVVKTSLRIRNDYKNKEGKYDSEFVNIEAWGKQAEYLKNFCQKGDIISIEGSFRTTSYESQNGKVYQSFVRVSSLANETPHFEEKPQTPHSFTPQEISTVDEFFAGTGAEIEHQEVKLDESSLPFY